ANIGVIVIDNETKTIEENRLIATDLLKNLPLNEDVKNLAESIVEAVKAEYAQAFATSEVLLNGDRAPGNRTEETNLGDLITDAMVWSVARDGGIENAEPNAIVGITNGGGIRAPISAGDVTKNDIVTVLPFGNTVAVIYVTGEELLEALEASTYATPDAIGGFPQTSGLVWKINTAKAYDQGDLYIVAGKETTYYAPASIGRVTIESVNGEPFDPAKTYAVVTNNFCAAGGDTYAVFERAYNEGSGFDTGIPMDQALMEYITTVLDGKITEEAYGAPQGRLTIGAEEAVEETPAEEAPAEEAPAEEAPAEETPADEAA
ncbi:MAG: 5'-nucleotidase C-terminal domain-containing protein, partial [Clostridia bacterium]|nr:5'-nucleotidase C-terminal domain-containing protein [Clostridia bacterium]